DAIFQSIHEDFAYQIISYRLNPGNIRIFDSNLPRNFRFDQNGTGRDQSFFAQDLWHRGGLTISAGLRFDHYRIIADETAWSPRLGIAYYIAPARLVLRASYDRVFSEPAIENLLLASSDLVNALGGEGIFIPLKPARGNYFEAGFSKGFGKLRLDGSWYNRDVANFGD